MQGPEGPEGPQGPVGPFLSSYLETQGNEQSVDSGENIVFDTDPADVDIAGNDISIDPSGSVFNITRTGLYYVEWSVNLQTGIQPIILCIMEDGQPASAMSHGEGSGNMSNGALINVTSVPYTISLNNFGGSIDIAGPDGVDGASVSIRIFRFADGPSV